MLHTLIIFDHKTGLSMWEKQFSDSIDPDSLPLYASFFSAIQSFTKEMQFSNSLRSIDMGELWVQISSQIDINIDLVTISDKLDFKIMSTIHDELISIFPKYSDLFRGNRSELSQFRILDLDILTILDKYKKFLHQNILNQEKLVKLKNRQKELCQSQYIEFLQSLTQKTPLLPRVKKFRELYAIGKSIDDNEILIQIENLRKGIEVEIENLKLKIELFLNTLQQALSKKSKTFDYASIFLPLYNLAQKLIYSGNQAIGMQILTLSKDLIDKKDIKYLNEVTKLPKNIDYYIPSELKLFS